MPAKYSSMGRLLVDSALPEEFRGRDITLDKKGMGALLKEIYEKKPDEYRDTLKRLNDVGRKVATDFGGYSFGLQHMSVSPEARRIRKGLQAELVRILSKPDLTPKQRREAVIAAAAKAQAEQMDAVFKDSLDNENPLALQAVSGSRGNKLNVVSLRGSDMLYTDHRDRVLPLPVMRSYSEGLTPLEYWAGTYGARKGIIAGKFAVSDAGFAGKQLNQVTHRLMVGEPDDPRDLPDRGLPVDTDDPDNEGALLARDFGPYKKNTPITPKIAEHIKALGHDRILVRSPIIGGSPDGGVYARDVGLREAGRLPDRGSLPGMTAAQALAEPLAQSTLSTKHHGGVAGHSNTKSGFAYINSLIQIPKHFRGGAAHATKDGYVSKIEPAPAGGYFIYVGTERHHSPAELPPTVKVGDMVEAGDILSEGQPNPAEITKYKGVGEGRRYFTNAFKEAMVNSGLKAHRRNVELLARGLINHVRLTEELGDFVPDDVVPYSTIEHLYEPREGHRLVPIDQAADKYLESPVLHHSIGTKVRPSVLKDLQHFGIKKVMVHEKPPPFEPEMIRAMASLQNDPDWMTRMYGSGLKTGLLDAVHRGSTSDEEGTSFVPSLARGVDFGRIGRFAPESGLKKLGESPAGTNQSDPGSSTIGTDGATPRPPANSQEFTSPAKPSPVPSQPATDAHGQPSGIWDAFSRQQSGIPLPPPPPPKNQTIGGIDAERAKILTDMPLTRGISQYGYGPDSQLTRFIGGDGGHEPSGIGALFRAATLVDPEAMRALTAGPTKLQGMTGTNLLGNTVYRASPVVSPPTPSATTSLNGPATRQFGKGVTWDNAVLPATAALGPVAYAGNLAVDAANAATSSREEMRQRFADKVAPAPATVGNVVNYFADNASHPISNLRSAGVVLDDAMNLNAETANRDLDVFAKQEAIAKLQIKTLTDTAQTRALTAEEQAVLDKANRLLAAHTPYREQSTGDAVRQFFNSSHVSDSDTYQRAVLRHMASLRSAYERAASQTRGTGPPVTPP